jgi:hypothetical protein
MDRSTEFTLTLAESEASLRLRAQGFESVAISPAFIEFQNNSDLRKKPAERRSRPMSIGAQAVLSFNLAGDRHARYDKAPSAALPLRRRNLGRCRPDIGRYRVGGMGRQ